MFAETWRRREARPRRRARATSRSCPASRPRTPARARPSVTGGVHAAHLGAGHPVHLDVPRRRRPHPGLSRPRPSVFGTRRPRTGSGTLRCGDRRRARPRRPRPPPHARRPRLRHHLHAAPLEDLLDQRGGVGILPRQHPVAAGDEDDVGAERGVRAGELGTGDPGADDDQALGQRVEVVELGPGEDPLTVGPAVSSVRGVAPVATRTTSASSVRSSTPSCRVTTTRDGPSSRPRADHDLHALALEPGTDVGGLRGRERLDAVFTAARSTVAQLLERPADRAGQRLPSSRMPSWGRGPRSSSTRRSR